MSVVNDMTAAEQLDRLRDELFAATAHAIKTPVAIIRAAAQVLSRTGPSGGDRPATIIERQASRIDLLIDNVLALSRIRSGTLQLHATDVELAPLLLEVLRGLEKRWDAYGIQLQVDSRPAVRADRERLAIVLRNTLEAAVRSSRSGVPVTIRLRHYRRDAVVEVGYTLGDAGCAEDGAPGTAGFDALGVGRCVAKALVEAHAGAFIETSDRESAAVQIRLPLAQTGE